MNVVIFVTILIPSVLSTRARQKTYEYFWRDYRNGIIPSDAVPGGLDNIGRKTFIGQAFFPNSGLEVARIYPDEEVVIATNFDNSRTLQRKAYVKILCSLHQSQLKWVQANSTTLHLSTINKHLVRGGTDNDGILYIGRVEYMNMTLIGKVPGYALEYTPLYIPYQKKILVFEQYEIISYELPPVA